MKWQTGYDASSGKTWWYNPKTGETKWEDPYKQKNAYYAEQKKKKAEMMGSRQCVWAPSRRRALPER